jgi:hypothetical protein
VKSAVAKSGASYLVSSSGRQLGGRIAFARASWTEGQGTSPNEQNTQQSPGFGFIRIPQLLQS